VSFGLANRKNKYLDRGPSEKYGRRGKDPSGKGGGKSKGIQRRHKAPYGCPSGRIEFLWKEDDSLPNTVSGLSR
jgi:hypothetical protein